jgi:hypothetical protein
LLQQLFAAAVPLHDFAQSALAADSEQAAEDLASVFEQHDLAGADASLLELTFSVFAFSAVVTFCAETVETVKAKIRVNNEITRATFFIVIICLMVSIN